MAAPRALLGRAPPGMRPAGQDMETLDVQSDLYACTADWLPPLCYNINLAAGQACLPGIITEAWCLAMGHGESGLRAKCGASPTKNLLSKTKYFSVGQKCKLLLKVQNAGKFSKPLDKNAFFIILKLFGQDNFSDSDLEVSQAIHAFPISDHAAAAPAAESAEYTRVSNMPYLTPECETTLFASAILVAMCGARGNHATRDETDGPYVRNLCALFDQVVAKYPHCLHDALGQARLAASVFEELLMRPMFLAYYPVAQADSYVDLSKMIGYAAMTPAQQEQFVGANLAHSIRLLPLVLLVSSRLPAHSNEYFRLKHIGQKRTGLTFTSPGELLEALQTNLSKDSKAVRFLCKTYKGTELLGLLERADSVSLASKEDEGGDGEGVVRVRGKINLSSTSVAGAVSNCSV